MNDLFYAALTNGDRVLFWTLAVLGGFIIRLVLAQLHAGKVRDLVGRALHEIGDAVLAVGKTYVESLKQSNADGKLTEAEKATAKQAALAIAKKNIGVDGLKRLGAVLGFGDSDLTHWLETKIESAVASVGPQVVVAHPPAAPDAANPR